jgi:eukaryotic-like serine/threonine-protein kinase
MTPVGCERSSRGLSLGDSPVNDCDRHDRVYAIFSEACEKLADERAAFLDRACAGDDDLRREVEHLLELDDDSEHADPTIGGVRLINYLGLGSESINLASFQGANPADVEQSAASDLTRRAVPERIGPYRILEVIGEGGMGVVYRAEQDNPRRDVALKVIRPGIASPRMLKRFALEAQTLGRLHHHGIAQIYEAGMFDSGFGPQPFFAMEFLQGRPLLEYANECNLNVRERLELLMRVCEAVEHAHSKCVIHRDLKPANIIVTEAEVTTGTGALAGQPKILDFGVARVTDSDLQATTIGTDIGQLIGTLPYMSPEQVGGQPDDLDTRSDVYALGVIGYELLTARRPHELAGRSLPDAVRIIREDDPVPLGSIDRAYRGDLETIIGKALEKEKQRRYQSPRELAEDVRRFLHDEPIAARKPSVLYHARKFAQRNRAMVIGATIAVIAVTVGLLGAVWAQAERQAYLETANMYKTQLKRTLETSPDDDPLKPQEVDREWLHDAARFVDRRLRRQPREAAELRNLIGLNYLNLDEYDLAHRQLAAALEARRALFRSPHADLAESLHNMGRVLWHQDEFVEAEDHYREALEMFIAFYGPEHRQIAETMSHIATCLRDRGECDDAEALYRKSLDMLYRMFGDEHQDIAANYNNMAVCLLMAGRYEEAAVQFERALDMIRRISDDPDDFRVARGKRRLGSALTKLGEFDRAQLALDEALDIYIRALGWNNRYAASIIYESAELQLVRGDHDRAVELAEQALEIQQGKFDDQLDTAKTLELLGRIHLADGDASKATAHLWDALLIRAARRRPGHADIKRSRELLDQAAVALNDRAAIRSRLIASPRSSHPSYQQHARTELAELLNRLD